MFNGENYETKFFQDPKNLICFGPYSKISPVIFPMTEVKNNLGEYLSNFSKKQLRIAETEKYAHVTFFFNSQIKEPYKNEERILINSPKCPSYAEKPEMSAYEVTNKLIEILSSQFLALSSRSYDFIVLNYANGDLVGHSGNLNATIKCCKVLDECLAKLIPEALKNNYEILITGDHGNCEEMLYPDGSAKPAHSMNKVPCLLISKKFKNAKLKEGKGLQDIAPTILELMNLEKPKEMEGKSLLKS
jgi:2,3-bisphosphoglycerate-independent phosphoglycerate mutase